MRLAAITMNATLLSSILAAPISQAAPRGVREQRGRSLYGEQRLVPRGQELVATAEAAKEMTSGANQIANVADQANQTPFFRTAKERELEEMRLMQADAVPETTPRNDQEGALHELPAPPRKKGTSDSEPRPEHFRTKTNMAMIGALILFSGAVAAATLCGVGVCSGALQRRMKARRQKEKKGKEKGKKV